MNLLRLSTLSLLLLLLATGATSHPQGDDAPADEPSVAGSTNAPTASDDAAAADVASSEDSATEVSAAEHYRLGASDVVEVFVWKEPELSRTITVRPDGRISLPLAGELDAAGATASQLETLITNQLREYVDNPLVTVIVEEINSPTISVLGEVRRPGRYVIPQRTTVLDAIAMSGGFTEFANRDHVTVFHHESGQTRPVRIEIKRLLNRGGESFVLQSGDTVHVE